MNSAPPRWAAALALAACAVAACAGPAPRAATAVTPGASGASPAAAATPTVVPTALRTPVPEIPEGGIPQTVSLPVHMHAQQNSDWCDPADLETWLELDRVVQPADQVAAQRAIWDYEVAHNDGFTLAQWHASPYAVAAAFDHFANRTDVGDQVYDNVNDAGLVISRSVAAQHEPVIALIDDGNHYVLISGVTLGPGSVSAPPASLTVHDPWTYGPMRLGYPALGLTTEMSWSDFVKHLTPDDPHDVGIWSGHRVLIARDLPLRG
jgi:hypothetical protein